MLAAPAIIWLVRLGSRASQQIIVSLLQAGDNVARQGVSESKSDEIGPPFNVEVGKVSARMEAE